MQLEHIKTWIGMVQAPWSRYLDGELSCRGQRGSGRADSAEVSLFPLLLQLPLRTESDALLGLDARAGKQNRTKLGPEPSLAGYNTWRALSKMVER